MFSETSEFSRRLILAFVARDLCWNAPSGNVEHFNHPEIWAYQVAVLIVQKTPVNRFHLEFLEWRDAFQWPANEYHAPTEVYYCALCHL